MVYSMKLFFQLAFTKWFDQSEKRNEVFEKAIVKFARSVNARDSIAGDTLNPETTLL